MGHSSRLALLLMLLASFALAQEHPPAASQPDTATAERLKLLQAQLQEQQKQIDLLKQQLLQSAPPQAQYVQTSTGQPVEGTGAGTASETGATAVEAGLSNEINTLALALEQTQKSVNELEHPPAMHFKGITITPGGFLESAFIVRSRNENADVIDSFSGVPFGGVPNASLSEFRATARGTRFSLLAEGNTGGIGLTGYYELDFLGQAPTANQVETNSFTPRQRQLWGQASFHHGLTLTAGQFWSLITTDRRGIATRAEFIPITIDGAYVVGFNYVRQTALRLTKNFNEKWWVAVEVANPETSEPNASYVPANLFGFNNSANAASPSGGTIDYLEGSTNGFSTNLAPDVLTKLVYEPGWGHYELKTVTRFFRDRISGQNNVTYGGGVGAAAILPIKPKKIDLIFEGLAGSGIGRYSAANGSDVTLRPDGWIIPLHALDTMGGVEFHPRPKLDVYLYGGNEYYGRAAYVNPTDATEPAGYGSPLVNNTYCNVEVVPSGGTECQAQNKDVAEATAGFWYRFYKLPGRSVPDRRGV